MRCAITYTALVISLILPLGLSAQAAESDFMRSET
jgi:hypothetical protein